MNLYAPMPIEPSELVQLILQFGGHITDEAELDATVSSDSGHIFIYGARSGLAGEFEEPEDGVEAKVGHPPCAGVYVRLSHDEGSQPLALRFAREFARRWSGAASCTAYTVMRMTDMEHLRAAGISPASTLALEVDIVLSTLPPVDELIAEFGGFSIDPADIDMMASATRALRELEHEDLDPVGETISGIIPSSDCVDIWVVQCQEWMCCGDIDCGICNAIRQYLRRPPTCRIRLVHGYSESGTANRTVLAIIERILQRHPGVLVGSFHLILNAEELAEALCVGNGFQLR